MSPCQFIPPFLLQKVADAHPDADAARCGHVTLEIDGQLRTRRDVPTPRADQPEVSATDQRPGGEDAWTVYTADNASSLPGDPVRSAGEPASGDQSVDEAYTGVEASLALFKDTVDRDSYDGRGAPVIATVHYQKNYDNAFWDGRQLVFGDGDGKVFERFTKPIDVCAHEFTHAVTQHTAALTYKGQSGALNESVSDAFASCVKQRVLGQTVEDADWLIGEGIFLPSVDGKALRSMAKPGTAYDDPTLGKDPQVGSMDDYVDTLDDNGGVHINSGIPNRAFYLFATALGGSSWEHAGPVWYAALTSGIGKDTDFAGFAQATVKAAADTLGPDAENKARMAWQSVAVTPGSSAPTQSHAWSSSGSRVEVRRTGGFAGIAKSGEVDLESDARAAEVRELLDRIDLQAATGASGEPQPDRYVYSFRVEGEEVTVAEQELTPDLSRLATLVLED